MTGIDAIVVGAGPAGASAAYHLACLGRQVLLLDRARFPRDKSCGDGLTRFATRQLAQMGVLDLIPDSALSQGVRIHMRGRGSRDFRYPADPDPRHQGLVVPRLVLDHAICRRAVEAGAVLQEETFATGLLRDAQGAVCGVVAQQDGAVVQLEARTVVAADGAASRLARQAGLYESRPHETGYAIRGYYEGIEGLGDLLEIHMPLRDPTDRYLLPSYGWAFPGPGTVNIGVGLVQRERAANVRELMGRFLDDLRRSDPRFAAARPCGEWRGAALRFDFQPQRCAAPGLLLAGDAAGMISPFTGEGISYALASGRLAAETIHRALADPGPPDLSDYARALARRFTGYFETGRESARRYRLIWHLLENTFQSDRPLYDICRRAALFPEGIGESWVQEAFEDVGPALRQTPANPQAEGSVAELAGVRADLMGVGETLLGTMRRNWPFLAGVVTVEESVPGVPLRPALLLLLAGRAMGPRPAVCIPLAAAVEMGFIAALAHVSVTEERETGTPGRANWGNRAALMVGDFLLGSAYAISADVAADASGMIADAVAASAEGHLRALRHAHDMDLPLDEHRAILEAKAGTLFELPCRLGARAAGAPPRVVAALGAYGRKLGVAYQIMHDLSVARGDASELGRAVGSNPDEGIYSLAIAHALRSDRGGQLRQALVARRAGAPTDVAALVHAAGGDALAAAEASQAIAAAKAALRDLPPGTLRNWLETLADSLHARD